MDCWPYQGVTFSLASSWDCGPFRGFVNWSEVGKALVLGKTVALWEGPRLALWQPLK